MMVHNLETGRPDEEVVHAHLAMAIVDYMARIKTCGHMGVQSEHHFCLYCNKRHCYLSVPEGFQGM
jgi:hypothetical protein